MTDMLSIFYFVINYSVRHILKCYC